MRLLPSACVLLLLGLTLAIPLARGAEFTLFKSVWGNVIVATDTAAAGRALTPPTPAQPVYFKGLSLGRRLGSIPGDREPEQAQLDQYVTGILARQGYLGARPGAPEPTLFLVVQWGYLQPDDDLLWFLGYNPAQDVAAPVIPGQLGPEVWLRGFRSREIETILQDAQDAIYGIIVTAFEFKSARTPTPVVYWQTRIGLPTHGKSMAAALPAMLIAAGPAIGRPADGPVLLDVDKARAGHVKLGELEFLDSLSEPPRREETDPAK